MGLPISGIVIQSEGGNQKPQFEWIDSEIDPMNKRITTIATTAIATGLLMAQQARATIVAAYGSDGAGSGLQTKLNPLVTPGSGDVWSKGTLSGADYINGTVQMGQSPLDVLWNLAGPGASATLVLEIAGNANNNTFGFYDPADLTKKAQLFAGPAGTGSKLYVKFNGTQLQSSSSGLSGSFVNVGSAFGSTTFGMYLQGNGGTFYSDSSKNAGGGDNLVAYQGFAGRTIKVNGTPTAWDANSYVLGWEDLVLSSSDHDYQDMVLLVSQIVPAPAAGFAVVPETSTWVAGSLLLLPFVASTIRILRKDRAKNS